MGSILESIRHKFAEQDLENGNDHGCNGSTSTEGVPVQGHKDHEQLHELPADDHSHNQSQSQSHSHSHSQSNSQNHSHSHRLPRLHAHHFRHKQELEAAQHTRQQREALDSSACVLEASAGAPRVASGVGGEEVEAVGPNTYQERASTLRHVNVLFAKLKERVCGAGDHDLDEARATSLTPCTGYELDLTFLRGKNLPRGDLIMRGDPYLRISLTTPNRVEIKCQTQVIWNSRNPEWNETFQMGHIPDDSILNIQVWDKDRLKRDDYLGKAAYIFKPVDTLEEDCQDVKLHVKRHSGLKAGKIYLKIRYKANDTSGYPCLRGPVRYKQIFSSLAGFVTRSWTDENTMQYCVYKAYLKNVYESFSGKQQNWNQDYAAAKQIMHNPVLQAALRTTHAALYASDSATRHGVLPAPEDFFELLNYGVRQEKHRYFTYVIMEESMKFSETSAAFFTDMMSKHALHSNCARTVYYSGEFCIVGDRESGAKLVIDNNSGTYSPDEDVLPCVKVLFESNWPGMEVQTLSHHDPYLKELHEMYET